MPELPPHLTAEGDQHQADSSEKLDRLLQTVRERSLPMPFPIDVLDLHDSFAEHDTSNGVYQLCEMLVVAINRLAREGEAHA